MLCLSAISPVSLSEVIMSRLKPGGRRSEKAGLEERKMRVIVYMQIAHVSPTRADTQACECVQTCRLLLVGQRLVGRARLKAM